MLRRFLTTVLPGMIACAFALQDAQADIYAWVDKSGNLTFSDLPPPVGARVIEVVSEGRPNTAARADPPPLRDSLHDAEVRILYERVRLLERQMDLANAQSSAPVVQYQTAPPPSSSWGCYGAWADCGPWWSQPVYPSAFGVVVVPARGFHRFHHFRGAHRFVNGTGQFHHR